MVGAIVPQGRAFRIIFFFFKANRKRFTFTWSSVRFSRTVKTHTNYYNYARQSDSVWTFLQFFFFLFCGTIRRPKRRPLACCRRCVVWRTWPPRAPSLGLGPTVTERAPVANNAAVDPPAIAAVGPQLSRDLYGG